MNLKQLEAFARVAETKSFSEAAKRLYLTQPTVSAHVSALEKELGVCLLLRTTKEVSLTEEGKALCCTDAGSGAGDQGAFRQKKKREKRSAHCRVNDSVAVSAS